MDRIIINIESIGVFRASEVVADLRNVAEILLLPMRCIGFWDVKTQGHICPHLQKGHDCPHKTAPDGLEAYRETVENELRGAVEVVFPHAKVYIYLS